MKVTTNELLQINSDNYVLQIVKDNIKKYDPNFCLDFVKITNDAKIKDGDESKEEYINYSFDDLRQNFVSCNIYVSSNCHNYVGNFSFKINVCGIKKLLHFDSQNFSNYKDFNVPLKHSDNNPTLSEKKDSLTDYVSSDPYISRTIFGFLKSSYGCVRLCDISLDESKEISLSTLNFLNDDLYQAKIFYKLNTNDYGENSVFSYTEQSVEFTFQVKFIKAIFSINDLQNDFNQIIKDLSTNFEETVFSRSIPSVNPSRVSAGFINDYFSKLIINKFSAKINEHFCLSDVFENEEFVLKNDYLKVIFHNGKLIGSAFAQDLSYYDLTQPWPFRIEITTPIGNSVYNGDMFFTDENSDIEIFSLYSSSKRKDLSTFVSKQTDFFYFNLPVGTDIKNVPKSLISNMLNDNNDAINQLVWWLNDFIDDIDISLIRDDSQSLAYFDYSLNITNFSTYPEFLDFSKSFEIKISITSSVNSLYLSNRNIVSLYFLPHITSDYKIDVNGQQFTDFTTTYTFSALNPENCSTLEIDSLSRSSLLLKWILNSLYNNNISNNCPHSFFEHESFDIDIAKQKFDYSSTVEVDAKVTCSSKIFSGIFYISFYAKADKQKISLADVTSSRTFVINVYTYSETNHTLDGDLISKLKLSDLNSVDYSETQKQINLEIQKYCPYVEFGIDYVVDLSGSLSTTESYDYQHPDIQGCIKATEDSRYLTDLTYFNFKIIVEQCPIKEFENVDYKFNVPFSMCDSYHADQVYVGSEMCQKTHRQDVEEHERGQATINVDNSTNCQVLFRYSYQALQLIDEYNESKPDKTTYTLKDLQDVGVAIGTPISTLGEYSSLAWIYIPRFNAFTVNFTFDYINEEDIFNKNFDFETQALPTLASPIPGYYPFDSEKNSFYFENFSDKHFSQSLNLDNYQLNCNWSFNICSTLRFKKIMDKQTNRWVLKTFFSDLVSQTVNIRFFTKNDRPIEGVSTPDIEINWNEQQRDIVPQSESYTYSK